MWLVTASSSHDARAGNESQSSASDQRGGLSSPMAAARPEADVADAAEGDNGMASGQRYATSKVVPAQSTTNAP